MPCTAPPSSCPLDDLRIDDAADVVDRAVGDRLDHARLRIDLDLADVAAVGPGRVRDRARRVDDDPRLRLRLGEIEQTDAAIGADDLEDAVGIFDVAGGNLQRAAASSRASITVRSAATRTAEPPTKSERDPALPKPVPRSVSPWTMRIRSIGTPNTSTASCA